MSPQEQRFVTEYLVDLNASQAAIRAGYSPRTAASQGQRLTRKPAVAEAIARAQDEAADRNRLTADWVIERLRATAEAGVRGDSVRALELLGKTLGLFRDRHEHSGPDGAAIPTSLEVRFVRPSRDEGSD